VVHFQADELPEDDRQGLLEHVDRCPDCARRLEFEESFLRGLKGRVGREPLPPGLETRVRASLDERSRPARSPMLWIRAPWFAVVAASLLLAVMLIPGLGGPDPGDEVGAIPVGRDAVLGDIDCSRAGRSVDEQRKCRHHRHINALKVADDTYWNISLEDEQFRELVLDQERRGQQIRVTGVYFPQLNTVRLEQVQDLSGTL
jgi:hypothetical protein